MNLLSPEEVRAMFTEGRRPFSLKTLAERWGCSERTVRNMIKNGDLRAFRVGGTLFRIAWEDVEKWETGQNLSGIAGVTGSSPVSPTKNTLTNQYVRPRALQCAKAQAYHIKRMRELFAYSPDEGVLYVKRTGKPAGFKNGAGYWRVRLNGSDWPAHRIIWEWCHGVCLTADDEIDHIDGDRLNNRIENLRKATRAENQWNAKVRKDNTSGFKGVSWHKRRKAWAANISIAGKVKCLGMYATPEEAHAAYSARAKELRGEFARVK